MKLQQAAEDVMMNAMEPTPLGRATDTRPGLLGGSAASRETLVVSLSYLERQFGPLLLAGLVAGFELVVPVLAALHPMGLQDTRDKQKLSNTVATCLTTHSQGSPSFIK